MPIGPASLERDLRAHYDFEAIYAEIDQQLKQNFQSTDKPVTVYVPVYYDKLPEWVIKTIRSAYNAVGWRFMDFQHSYNQHDGHINTIVFGSNRSYDSSGVFSD